MSSINRSRADHLLPKVSEATQSMAPGKQQALPPAEGRLISADLICKRNKFKVNYNTGLTFLILFTALQVTAGQCPWRKDSMELHSDCICDFSPGQSSQASEPVQLHPINRMSIQCSTVNFVQLMSALKQTASIELPDLIMLKPDVSNSSSADLRQQMAEQLVSQAKLDLLHISNSSIEKLSNNTFLDEASRLRQQQSTMNSQQQLVVAIQSLHLSRCGIVEVEAGAFNGLQWTLTSLSLSDNQLEQVPVQALEILTRLKVLDLSNNKLLNIRPNSFFRLNKLATLRLADNRLSTAPQASSSSSSRHLGQPLNELTFAGLEDSLIDLNLKNTQLGSFPDTAIKNLRKIAFLNLAQNQISYLPSRAFARMTSLTAINLERNRISALEEGTFSGLENSLSSLSLLGNLLDAFPVGELSKLTNLRRLDLGFNNIELVPENALKLNERLILIALDGNPLETLPEAAFKSLAGSLRGMSVGGKLLNCDCRLSWIIRWQRDFNLQISSRERNPQFCARPHYLRSLVSFSALKPEHLTCDQARPTTTPPSVFAPPRSVDNSLSWSVNGTNTWLGYFTMPAEVSSELPVAATTMTQLKRETTQIRPSQILHPITTTTSGYDLTADIHRSPITANPFSLASTDDSPSTSHLLQQLETSATTMQLSGNAVGSLPDDELFVDMRPQRKLNRHGYIHHSQRIKPLPEAANSTAQDTAQIVAKTNDPPEPTTPFDRNDKAVTQPEPGLRLTKSPHYGSFGERAANATIHQSSRKQNSTVLAVASGHLSKASSGLQRSETSQVPLKGTRLVDEQAIDESSAFVPLMRPRGRSTMAPQQVPTITPTQALGVDRSPATVTIQTTKPSPSPELDLRRVELTRLQPTVSSSSSTPSPLNQFPNNTRMSVSSMYRLATPRSSSSTLRSSIANAGNSTSSTTMPTTTTSRVVPTVYNSPTLTTLKPHDRQQLETQRRIDQPGEVATDGTKVSMAVTVRYVDSILNSSSPTSNPNVLELRPPISGGVSTDATTQTTTASTRDVVTETRHEASLPVASSTYPANRVPEVLSTASGADSGEPTSEIPTTEVRMSRHQEEHGTRPTMTERKLMSASKKQLQISPRLLGPFINLTDFDQMALIFAGVLCLMLLVLAISVTCFCYSSRRPSGRHDEAHVDIFPIASSKQQLRNSFGSSLESSSSGAYVKDEGGLFCCFKGGRRKNQRARPRRSLLGEDDSSSGVESAGSGAHKSSGSASSGAKSTVMLAPANRHHPAFATVGKTKRTHRSLTSEAGRSRVVRCYDSRTLEVSSDKLRANSLRPFDHSEAFMRHREAHAANLEYLTIARKSAHTNSGWSRSQSQELLGRATSSLSCDSDKSCSPGANKNNHYNMSEAHRAYLGASGIPFDAAMFVSTAGCSSTALARKSGLLKTMDTYQDNTSRLSSDKSTTDDSRAPLSSVQASKSARKLNCRFDFSEEARQSSREASNFAISGKSSQQRPSSGSIQNYLENSASNDYLNSDLVPMSAEDQWPEPYIDPMTGSDSEPQHRASMHAQLKEEYESRELQSGRAPVASGPSKQPRSEDLGELMPRRGHTHRRTASNSHRRIAYDDAYLSNWHTMSRLNPRAQNMHQFRDASNHLITPYYHYQEDFSRQQRPMQAEGGSSSSLLRYRSIPSLNESNPHHQLKLGGATNWLRWTPTDDIRPSSRAPIILDSNDTREASTSQQHSATQDQQLHSASGWFTGENQLEAVYISSNQAAH